METEDVEGKIESEKETEKKEGKNVKAPRSPKGEQNESSLKSLQLCDLSIYFNNFIFNREYNIAQNV